MQRGSKVGTVALVGDVGPCRADPDSMFKHVGPILRAADVGFCQLEPALTARSEPMPQARLAMRAPPQSAAAIHAAGFHVVSCAGNHCLDFGAIGLSDTVSALRTAGLSVVGVGDDLTAARKPVYIAACGLRLAFLAYSSILPMGYAAADRPGCAPLRAWTHAEQIEPDQPGTPARLHTFAHREDLSDMREDILAARAHADRVIVSIHWGVHFVPGELAAYQREIAHAAVDAGASLIVGHHPHVLKGIEVYRGVPVLYSLGNFALDPPTAFATNLRDSKGFREIRGLTNSWDDATLLPADTRLSLLALWKPVATRLELIPVHLNAGCEPTFPMPKEKAFEKVIEYLDWTCTSQDLPVPYRLESDRLTIEST